VFYFGKRSRSNLSQLSYNLQKVARTALQLDLMDFAITCSFRGEMEQNEFFRRGKSKVEWPNSKHNKWPAEAMDLVPYVGGKISWNKFHCCCLAYMILTVGKMLEVDLRWGGNWDMDGEPITDQDFQDLVHFEEVK